MQSRFVYPSDGCGMAGCGAKGPAPRKAAHNHTTFILHVMLVTAIFHTARALWVSLLR